MAEAGVHATLVAHLQVTLALFLDQPPGQLRPGRVGRVALDIAARLGPDAVGADEQRHRIAHLELQGETGASLRLPRAAVGHFVDQHPVGVLRRAGLAALADQPDQLPAARLDLDEGRAGNHCLLVAIDVLEIRLGPAEHAHLQDHRLLAAILQPQRRGWLVGFDGRVDRPDQHRTGGLCRAAQEQRQQRRKPAAGAER